MTKKDMRIGIDGRSLQGEPRGGVGQYTHHLLCALFSMDQENEYVVWYNGIGRLEVPDFSPYKNVRVVRTRWPNKILNVGMKVWGWPKFPPLRVRGDEPPPDGGAKKGLEASHNAPQPPLTLRGGERLDLFFLPNPNFVALPEGVKLVTVAHDLSFEHFPEFFSWKSRLWHKAVNPRALFCRADHLIAVSEHTKNDVMETYGIAPEKVSVAYPGRNDCHPEEPRDEGSRTRVRVARTREILRGVNPDQSVGAQNDGMGNYILYLGALEPRKNIVGVIEAFEGLESMRKHGRANLSVGLRLIIAGLATPYVTHLKKRIAQSKLRAQIVLKENPSEAEKDVLYRGATLFVYPSFYEGFGFPPLEAMSYGIPVVASSAASVPEVCGEAAVLVSPWKVEEIKEGMRVLLEDDAVRARYIAAGSVRVREFFWEQCAQQVLEIFQSL